MPAFVSLRRPASVVIAALVALALMPLFSPSASAAPLAAEPSLADGTGSISGSFDAEIPNDTPMKIEVFEKKALPSGHPWTERPELALTTAARTWKIDNVPAGQYTLRFSVADNRAAGIGSVFLGGSASLSEANLLIVQAGKDFATTPVRKGTAATLSAKVKATNGGPAAASITLLENLAVAGGAAHWRERGTFEPDASGVAFTINNLAGGKYKVRYNPLPGKIGRWYKGKDNEADATVYPLPAGCACNNGDLDTVLWSGPGTISGRTTPDPDAGAPWPSEIRIEFIERVVNDDKTVEWIDRPDLARSFNPQDDSGRYAVEGVPPGEYTLRFRPTSSTFLSYSTMYLGGVARLGDAQTVKVTKNAIVQAPELVLPVAGKIFGSVKDAAGKPAGSRVTLFEAFPGQNGTVSWRATREVPVTSEGHYLIEQLAPTSYILRFDAREPYLPQYSVGQDDLASANPVAVRVWEDVNLDAELVKGGTLAAEIGVADNTGPAAAGTPVELFKWMETSTGYNWVKKAEKTATVGTASDGQTRAKVSFGSLDNGEYTMKYGGDSTQIGPYVAHFAGHAIDSSKRAWYLKDAAKIEVKRGITTTMKPTLRHDSNISGVIRDQNDDKIAIANVKATLWAKRYWGTDTEQTYQVLAEQNITKAADGMRFDHLGPGLYKVQFTVGDGSPYKSQWFNQDLGVEATNIEQASEVLIAEDSGQVTHAVNPVLRMGGEVSGAVLDGAGGSGLNGYKVYLYDADTGRTVRETLTITRNFVDGTYAFFGLKPGNYKVRFNDEGENEYLSTYFKEGAALGTDTLSQATTLTVSASAMKHTNKRIQLKKGLAIKGKVSGSKGGSDVQVQLYTKPGQEWTAYGKPVKTDSAGNYSRPGLRSGTYKIGFSDLRTQPAYRDRYFAAADDLDSASPVNLGTVDSSSNHVTMPDAATISGTVTQGETPSDGVKAVAYRRTGSGSTSKFTAVRTVPVAANGTYRLTPLAVGDYKVRFVDAKNEYAPVFYDKESATGVPTLPIGTDLTLADGKAIADVDVTLTPGAILGGKLNHDAPQADLTVTVYQQNGDLGVEDGWVPVREVKLGSSDASAPVAWSEKGLPSGQYRIRVADSSGTLATQFYGGGATLSDSMTMSLPLTAGSINFRVANMTLKGASKIQGVLTDKDDAGVANVQVRAFRYMGATATKPWDAMPVTTKSLPSGAYNLGSLPAGTYRVEFDDQDKGLHTEYYNNSATLDDADNIELGTKQIVTGIGAKLEKEAPVAKKTARTVLSTTAATITEGTFPTITVRVSSAGNATPKGKFIVKVDGKAVVLPTGKDDIDANGLATLTLDHVDNTDVFSMGRHEMVAVYTGSDLYQYATSEPVVVSVVPSAPATLTSLRLGSAQVESKVTTSADVWVDSLGEVVDGAVELVKKTPEGLTSFSPKVEGALSNGHVRLTTPQLGLREYDLVAVYRGTRLFRASESLEQHLSVVKAGSTVTFSLEDSELVTGQTMKATATVVPNTGVAVAPGTVDIMDSVSKESIGSAPVDDKGVAVVEIPDKTLSIGNHGLTAVYSGNDQLAQAVSARTENLAVISGVYGARVLTSGAPETAVYGETKSVSVRATRLDGTPPKKGQAQLQIQDGTLWKNIGEPVQVDAKGAATVPVPTVKLGGVDTKVLRVAFSGGATLGDGSSNAFNLNVSKASATATASVSQANPVGESSVVRMKVESTLVPDAEIDGSVQIYVDGEQDATRTGTITDGKGDLSVAGLSFGRHVIKVVFTGNNLLTSASAETTIDVPNAASTTRLTIAKPSVTFDEDVVTTVEVSSRTVPAAQVSGTATLYLHHGTEREKVLATGVVSATNPLNITFKANKLAIGTNSVEAVFTPGVASPVGTSSAATDVTVAKAKFSKIGTAAITGTAKVGKDLTANPGDWAKEANKAYTWYVDEVEDKTVTTETYPLKATHVGAKITVKVTGSAEGYETESSTSVATDKVAKGTIDNPPAVTIEGGLKVGKELTAKHDAWPAGIRPTYAWSVDGKVVTTAVARTFTLEPKHVGATVSVSVTGSAEGYDPATSTSPVSAPVAKGTFEATPKVFITGTARVGAVLTAKHDAWPSGTKLVYSWIVDGKEIGNAKTLTIAPAQVGKKITLEVTGTVEGYDPAPVTSSPTAVVAAAKFTRAPKPVITGRATVNGTLAVRAGAWKPSPRFTVQWMANGVAVKGATRSTFKPTAAHARKRIQVAVTASAPGYVTTKVVSNPVTIGAVPKVNPAAAVKWKLSAKKKGKATLVLRAGRLRPTGTVQVFDGRRAVTTRLAVRLAAGNRMVIKLPKLKKGKHAMKLVYSGNAQINAKTLVKVVKVKK